MKEMDMKYGIKPLSEEESDLLSEKLDAYLETVVPSAPGTPAQEEIVLCVKDGEGQMIAGAIVNIYLWGRAVLSTLWTEERYRREGLGSLLLREAEGVAAEKGCRLMTLATLAFMARPFYEKHGYRVFTTNRDFPKGHEGWSMMKWLKGSLSEYVPSHNSAASACKVETGGKEEARIIHRAITRFNEENIPSEHDEIIISKKLVDEEGRLIAGISGMAGDWNACSIDVLWVEEAYRKQGLGSYLLREVEEEAKKYGTYIMLSEAGDWNEGFFRKNGYAIRGTLDNYPREHKCYELEKRF